MKLQRNSGKLLDLTNKKREELEKRKLKLKKKPRSFVEAAQSGKWVRSKEPWSY